MFRNFEGFYSTKTLRPQFAKFSLSKTCIGIYIVYTTWFQQISIGRLVGTLISTHTHISHGVVNEDVVFVLLFDVVICVQPCRGGVIFTGVGIETISYEITLTRRFKMKILSFLQ